jgi:hypothetical protein
MKIAKGFTGIICQRGIHFEDNKGVHRNHMSRGINIEDKKGVHRNHMSKRNKH